MAPTHDPNPPSETGADAAETVAARGHEPNNMHVGAIVILVIAFIVLGLITHLLLWWLVKADASPRPVDHPLSTVPHYFAGSAKAPPLQPTPGHEDTPDQDLQSMRRAEDSVFADLGWQVDPAHHTATPPASLAAQVAAAMTTHAPPPATTAPASHPVITPIPGADQGVRK